MDTLFIFCAGLATAIVLWSWKGWLPESGRWKAWCPNVVSILSVPFCWVAYFIFWVLMGNIYLTMIIYAPGVGGDLIDGRLAKGYKRAYPHKTADSSWRGQLLFPGVSKIGPILDPICDKVRVVPIYAYNAIVSFGSEMPDTGVLFAGIALIEVLAGIERVINGEARVNNGGNHAKGVGKIKALLQHAVLIPWVFIDFFGGATLCICLCVTLILTILSPIGRMIKQAKEKKTL